MNTIAFSCARCGAALKVLKTFAGKTILCPRCAKKTPVPGVTEQPGGAATASSASPSPAVSPPAESATPSATIRTSVPVPPSSEPEPSSSGAGISSLSTQLSSEETIGKERLERKEAEIRALTERIRELETQLETARLRLERAEGELAALRKKSAEEIEQKRAEWTAQSRAELEAARAVIARLEKEIRERTVVSQAGDSSVAVIEQALLKRGEDFDWESEAARADVALSEIRNISFYRFVRAALVIHVLVLGLTSLGYLFRRVRPEAEPSATPDAPAPAGGVTNPVPPVSDGAAPTGAVTVPVRSEPPAAPPSQTSPPTPAPEWETLPAPGEAPPRPSDIELKL